MSPLILLVPAGLWIGLVVWMKALRKGNSVGEVALRIGAIISLSAAFVILALLAMKGTP